MRRITAALLLTTCLAASEGLQAQIGNPTAEAEQAKTQQTSTEQTSATSTDEDKKSATNKGANQQAKASGNAQPGQQSNCVPDAGKVGEGDPDAPQNRIEYGGGG